MAKYTFKERASIYFMVEANSKQEALDKLDAIKIEVPKEVVIDVLEVELLGVEE